MFGVIDLPKRLEWVFGLDGLAESMCRIDESITVYSIKSDYAVTRRVDGSTRRVELVVIRPLRERGDSMSPPGALDELRKYRLLTQVDLC